MGARRSVRGGGKGGRLAGQGVETGAINMAGENFLACFRKLTGVAPAQQSIIQNSLIGPRTSEIGRSRTGMTH
jgi:hypothetical protein